MEQRETGEGLVIGFDAKRVFHNYTGLGNYSRTLLWHLHTCYPDIQFHLFSPEIRQNKRTQAFIDRPNFHLHPAGFKPYAMWRSLGIGREVEERHIPLYHGLSQELPFDSKNRSFKKVVSVHDLIFRHYPKQYAFIDRLIYDYKVQHAVRSADLVVAISEATKKDLVEAFELSPDKVKVIYQTCADAFWKEQDEDQKQAILNRYNLPPEYILSVGSVIKRKNLLTVIEGMGLLSKDLVPLLVVVGDGGQYLQSVKEKIRELELEEKVRFLTEITFADLPALYRGAMFSVYASSYEGFGIPILESLASGTPVLTSKLSSLPEVAGGGGHYLEEVHPLAMAEALEKMLTDKSYREELVVHGKQHIQRFRGKTLAAQWVKTYRGLLD